MSSKLHLALLAAWAAAACDQGAAPSSHRGKRTDLVSADKCTAAGWTVVDGGGCVPPVVATRDECVAHGGQSVQLLGDAQPATCFLPTPDGGAPCADSAQCGGFCEAPPDAKTGVQTSGTCSLRTQELCWNEMRKGSPIGPECF